MATAVTSNRTPQLTIQIGSTQALALLAPLALALQAPLALALLAPQAAPSLTKPFEMWPSIQGQHLIQQ